MEITDIKGRLHDQWVLAVLADCQYMPTEEKMQKLADRYEADPDIYAFGCGDEADRGGLGVIILKRRAETAFEIMGIAVEPAARKRGVGAKLIDFAAQSLGCQKICAETDDGAMGFYRRCGFRVESLGEKYPGCVRYWCTLSLA